MRTAVHADLTAYKNPSAGAEDAMATPRLDDASVIAMLKAQGFAAVGNIVRSGTTISADAVKDGRVVRVTIDARSGTVVGTR